MTVRGETVAVAALCLATIVAGWIVADPQTVGLYHDDGIYVATAKSLAEHGAYRLINVPGQPFQTKYPPLYPAGLAAIWRVRPHFPANVSALKAVNAVLLGAILAMTWMFSRRAFQWGSPLRVLAIACVATCLPLFAMADLVMSEPLFIVWLLGFVIASPSVQEAWTPRRVLWAAAAAAAAALTRSIGGVLGVVLIVMLVRRRAFRLACLALAVFVVPVGVWIWWSTTHRLAEDGVLTYYVQYERNALSWILTDPVFGLRIIGANAIFFAAASGRALGLGGTLLLPMCATFAALATWSHESRWPVTAVPLAFAYFLVTCTHPFPIPRYLLPLAPLAYLAVVEGSRLLAVSLAQTTRAGQDPRARMALQWLAPVVVILYHGQQLYQFRHLTQDAVHVEEGRPSGLSKHALQQTAAWIRRHTMCSDVIAATHDPFYFLYTGRKGVRPWIAKPQVYSEMYGRKWVSADPAPAIQSQLDRLGVTVLVVDRGLPGVESEYVTEQLRRLLTDAGSTWIEESIGDSSVRVYRRTAPDPSRPTNTTGTHDVVDSAGVCIGS